MVAVPEAAGVHWKTSSGEPPELPQLPACVLVPLVVPPKLPPWAGTRVGLLQAPPASVVVVVEVALGVVVVVVGAAGGVAVGVTVAVPEAAGVHWKTSSGELPELPQLPACVLVPLVVPPKVPPSAGITVGLLQAPPSVVVVVEVVLSVVTVDVVMAGGTVVVVVVV